MSISRLSAVALAAVVVSSAAPAEAAGTLYGAPVTYEAGPAGAGNGQAAIAAADLDGDGDQDLVMTDPLAGQLRVLFNDGAGAFTGEVRLATGEPGEQSVVAVDLDSDGLPDLATVDQSAGSLRVFHNGGARAFHQAADYTIGSRAYYVLARDFDGDGRVDLAVLNTDSQAKVTVLLGDGRGGLTPLAPKAFGGDLSPDLLLQTTYPGFQQLAAGDVDGDGVLDLVTVGGSKAYLLHGNGDGTFRLARTVQIAALALEGVQLGDVNGDGRLDLVVPVPAVNSIQVLPGRGDGTFAFAIVSSIAGGEPLLTGTEMATLADLDDDGDLDLAAGGGLDRTVWILTGDGTGRFATEQRISAGPGFSGVARCILPLDLNGDGKPDLAVGSVGPDARSWVVPHT